MKAHRTFISQQPKSYNTNVCDASIVFMAWKTLGSFADLLPVKNTQGCSDVLKKLNFSDLIRKKKPDEKRRH